MSRFTALLTSALTMTAVLWLPAVASADRCADNYNTCYGTNVSGAERAQYPVSPSNAQYPDGTPGTWSVYATPPWLPNARPGPQDMCGTGLPYQGSSKHNCPKGWNLWYR